MSGLTLSSTSTTATPLSTASLPSSPTDGQVAYFQPSPGYTWKFRYNATSPHAEKWEYAGGPRLFGYDSAYASLVAPLASWQPLIGANFDIEAPLEGLYEVDFSCYGYDDSGADNFLLAAPYNGTDTPVDDFGATFGLTAYEMAQFSSSPACELYLYQFNSLSLRFYSLGGDATFGGCKISLRPIRVL